MSNVWILAAAEDGAIDNTVTMEPADGSMQTDATVSVDGSTVSADGEQAAPPQKMAPGQILLLVGLFIMMYFMLFHGPKKQQKKQQQLRDSLQKNDKVITIGGIYGTILDVTDGVVTLKVDESSNAKIKMKISAIAGKADAKQA